VQKCDRILVILVKRSKINQSKKNSSMKMGIIY